MQTSINTRIKRIVDESGKTKTEFAKSLGVTQQYISKLITTGNPSNLLVDDICEKYDINKAWLLNEIGDPYKKHTRNQEIAAFMNNVMSESDESIKKRFISALAQLNERDWETLVKIADALGKKEDD